MKENESQYMAYMRIRSEEIKAGKGLSEATDIAFQRAYKQEIKGEDMLSPKNQ